MFYDRGRDLLGAVRYFEQWPKMRIAILADLPQDIALLQLAEADGEDKHHCLIPQFGQTRKAKKEVPATNRPTPTADIVVPALEARQVLRPVLQAPALLQRHLNPFA